VKSCVIRVNTKKISAVSQTVATAMIAHKICQGQPPIFGSHSSRFRPNRFTFGRVKTVLLHHRVFYDRLFEPIITDIKKSDAINAVEKAYVTDCRITHILCKTS